MTTGLPFRSLLDEGRLPVAEIAHIAKREGMRPRPVYQAHKWFARRFATTARSLLTAAASPAGTNFWKAYYGKASCESLAVLDPFMGGGVMLLEAARLGAAIYGVDVEPVAAVVSDFQGRLWGVPPLDDALAVLRCTVGERLAPFYAAQDQDGNRETLLHSFWVQTVDCALCGYAFDAHPKFQIAWNEATQWAACRDCSRVLHGKASAQSLACSCGRRTRTLEGHCERNAAVCPRCRHVERLIDLAKRCGKPRFRMFAVETIPAGPERRYPNHNRRIRTATEFDVQRYEAAANELAKLSVNMPDGPIPRAGRSDDRLVRYGYSDYSELFNARQKLHLALLAIEIAKFQDPVREAMVIAFSDHLTTNNMLCAYAGGWRRLSPLFAIRAYRHIPRPVEVNPWLEHNGRGTFPNAVRAVGNAADALKSSAEPTVAGLSQIVPSHRPRVWDIRCGDARKMPHIENASVDLVLTDPPYFDYISYSELGHFYVPWLVHFGLVRRQHLKKFPAGQLASLGRSKEMAERFGKSLGEAMTEIARICKPSGRIAFTYQNLDGRGWSALATAMASAGIIPINVFPMFGDGAAGLHKHENSISWDCVVVCKLGPLIIDLELPSGERDGERFMLTWSKRLTAAGHALSPGDLANFKHAGTLLGAFRRRIRTERRIAA